MSPSRPLTAKQRARRRERRVLAALAADIASTGLVRAPDGRLGYFVPAARTDELPEGRASFARV